MSEFTGTQIHDLMSNYVVDLSLPTLKKYIDATKSMYRWIHFLFNLSFKLSVFNFRMLLNLYVYTIMTACRKQDIPREFFFTQRGPLTFLVSKNKQKNKKRTIIKINFYFPRSKFSRNARVLLFFIT